MYLATLLFWQQSKETDKQKTQVPSDDTQARVNPPGGIAQWVERPTEKPNAILTRVRVTNAAI